MFRYVCIIMYTQLWFNSWDSMMHMFVCHFSFLRQICNNQPTSRPFHPRKTNLFLSGKRKNILYKHTTNFLRCVSPSILSQASTFKLSYIHYENNKNRLGWWTYAWKITSTTQDFPPPYCSISRESKGDLRMLPPQRKKASFRDW